MAKKNFAERRAGWQARNYAMARRDSKCERASAIAIAKVGFRIMRENASVYWATLCRWLAKSVKRL